MSLQHTFGELRAQLAKRIIGQEKLVDRLLIALLADGHLLVEGAPGAAGLAAGDGAGVLVPAAVVAWEVAPTAGDAADVADGGGPRTGSDAAAGLQVSGLALSQE